MLRPAMKLPDTIHIPVLLGLILTGYCIATPSQAETLDTKDILSTFSNRQFEASFSEFKVNLTFLDDGTMAASGALGTFYGEWQVLPDGICVLMDYGPRQGADCMPVIQHGDILIVGDDVRLQQTASAYRLDGITSTNRPLQND